MKKIKVLIADDHPFFRDGIRQMLSGQRKFSVIGEAASGREVMQKLCNENYDIVVMDIKMPDMGGIEATLEIGKQHPLVKVLAMSTHDDHLYITKMMRAGAKGYLLKNSGKDDLMKAIEKIMKGGKFFSNEVSGIMMTHILEGKSIPRDDMTDAALTKREIEIIRMIAEEQTNAEIGKMLGISTRTVDSHRRNILQKLKVRNSAGLVKYAIRNKLME